jgi:Na+/H+-dicarboxylate symporter
MFRTAANVTGDMTGAVVLGRRERATAAVALQPAGEPAP